MSHTSRGASKKASQRGRREPSKRSLREIPEVDFRHVRVKRNPHADGFKAQAQRQSRIWDRDDE